MGLSYNRIAKKIVMQGKTLGDFKGNKPLICRDDLFHWLESLIHLLFPARCLQDYQDERTIEQQLRSIKLQLEKILSALMPKAGRSSIRQESFSAELINEFLGSLPDIQKHLIDDARFFLQQDPACTSLQEVFIGYPGFLALAIHRFSHFFYQKNLNLMARIMNEYAHEKTGIDIHPGAKIKSPCFIDHGTGIVIGETTEIGKRVKIFQGVTLGALSVDRVLFGKKRHPTIEDNCILYANATILGGETIIGKGTIIGGNVWLTESVPGGSRIYHEGQVKKLLPKRIAKKAIHK